MANHRGVKLCKAKGQYTENRTANLRMSRTVLTDLCTQSRTFRFFWDCKGIFHWPFFSAILLFFAKALHLGKTFSVLFITELNTALLVERCLTAAISYISSASVMLKCWQNLSKLTNQRVYQILVYWNDLLLSFPHRRSLASSRRAFFYFFARCFLHCALTNWTPQWKRLLHVWVLIRTEC